MTTYKQIEHIVAAALKAKKKATRYQITKSSFRFSSSPSERNLVFQDYLFAYYEAKSQVGPVPNIKDKSSDDNALAEFLSLQSTIEEAAALAFLEALQDAAQFHQSEENFWAFLGSSAGVAGFCGATAAFAYFAPTAAAGTVAVLVGGIPFVLVLILALVIGFLAANAGSSGSDCCSNDVAELAKALFAASVYIGIATFPYAFAAMPAIAIGSAGIAALGVILMISAGIGIAVQRYRENSLFSTSLKDKLAVSLYEETSQKIPEEAKPSAPPAPYSALDYLEEDRDRAFTPMGIS